MPFNEPGHCGRVACYFYQGLEWCNEVRTYLYIHIITFRVREIAVRGAC